MHLNPKLKNLKKKKKTRRIKKRKGKKNLVKKKKWKWMSLKQNLRNQPQM